MRSSGWKRRASPLWSGLLAAGCVASLVAQAPAPRPAAPQPGRPSPPAQPAAPPAQAIELPSVQEEAAPTAVVLGVSLYPTAQFIRSYDAGRGQRFYIFATPSSFADVVNYYRNLLKQRGELVFERPATQFFENGRFREESMAVSPGVTVKDFTATGSAGYPNPKAGAAPAAFATVIQIVPPGAQ